MSFIFGGGGAKAKPQYTGLQTQTSTSTLPIPIGFGKNRAAPNIIWQDDFKSSKHKEKTGKGFLAPSQTTFTYSASFVLGMGWGQAVGVDRMWKDQSKETDYTVLGFSFFAGTPNQAPWGYLTTNHPDAAFGYPNIVYLAVSNYDLGQTNVLSQHSFEVEWPLVNTQVDGTGDADPALCIQQILENTLFGLMPAENVIDETTLYSGPNATTTGDSAFQTYCRAMGFGISPLLSSQEKGSEVIQRWSEKLCNTALVWTGYSLKFISYERQTVDGHGVKFVPDTTVRASFTMADYIAIGDQEPITFDRTDTVDAYNSVKFEIKNRNNEYNTVPVEWRDTGLVDQYNLRPMDGVTAHEVCEPTIGATMAALYGQRKAYLRNTYSFKVGSTYCLLEPMDLITFYHPVWGTLPGYIEAAEEDENGDISVVVKDFFLTLGSSGGIANQPTSNTPLNTNAVPGPINTPIIFEPPAALSNTPQVWLAVSGGDGTNANASWGGANVWISLDNITYDQIATVDGPARQGKLTANLSTYVGANPDVSNTLKVDMAMSNGPLYDASSSADAANGVTVSLVGSELIGYETALLTGANAYDLTTLYRGMYGTSPSSHTTGDGFARLDEAILKLDIPPQYIGQTVYFKFQSFNIFGGATEDLASCTAYSHAVSGAGYGTGSAGVPTTPDGFTGGAGAGYGNLTWSSNSVNDNVTGYQVWRSPGPGGVFGSASLVGTVAPTATTYRDSTAIPGTVYTYFLVAVNKIGSSANTAGVDVTAADSGAPAPFGFAFQWPDPVVSKPIVYFDTPLSWTIPTSLTDSQGSIGDSPTVVAGAPSAQTDFDIQSPPGTSIGTMRFAASSLTAVFIKASSSTIPVGQPVAIIAPANLNGMTGMIYGSIRGTR